MKKLLFSFFVSIPLLLFAMDGNRQSEASRQIQREKGHYRSFATLIAGAPPSRSPSPEQKFLNRAPLTTSDVLYGQEVYDAEAPEFYRDNGHFYLLEQLRKNSMCLILLMSSCGTLIAAQLSAIIYFLYCLSRDLSES